jgi:alpha-glucosidase
MVQEWRVLIDAYTAEKGGDTRVLFVEAWASVEDTVRYYADEEGKPRAHFPFNFLLIENLNEDSNAYLFKNEIDIWMTQVPIGATSNWVVSLIKIVF